MKRGLVWIIAPCLCMVVYLGCGQSAGETGRRRAEEPAHRSVLIFCDVTSSLSETEVRSVADTAIKLVESLTPSDDFAIYPLHQETVRAEPIRKDSGFRTGRLRRDRESSMKIREGVTSALLQLYQDVNRAQSGERTCILKTVPFVSSYFRDKPGNKKGEVFYLSDMIEECSQTPYGIGVNLKTRRNRDGNLALAGRFREKVPEADLSKVRVTVLIPSVADATIVRAPGPDVRELQFFWTKLFETCGVNDAAFRWMMSSTLEATPPTLTAD